MKTKIDKSFFIEAPVDKVWNLLKDPQEVVVCVPGASITEAVDERNYKGNVSLKFGPVKSVYNGEIIIEQIDPSSRRMLLIGKGLDSKGKGSAEMEMNGSVNEKDNGSQVEYSMEVTVTGMLAQFGSRLITDVSNQLFDQFVQNFKNKLAETPSTPAASAVQTETKTETAAKKDNSVNAFSILWAVIKGFFKRLFGKAG